MTEINTIEDILKFDPKTATIEELQKVYKTVVKLNKNTIVTTNDYIKWNKNSLACQIACNIYSLDKDNKEYLHKTCDFSDLIEIQDKEDNFSLNDLDFNLRINLFNKLIEFNDKKSLDKAYNILNQISNNYEPRINIKELDRLKYNLSVKHCYLENQDGNQDGNQDSLNKAYDMLNRITNDHKDIDIKDLNNLKYDLALKYCYFGDKESLDKAYDMLKQISKNHEGIDIKQLNELRYNLSEKYCFLGKQTKLNKAYDILNQISKNHEGIDIKQLNKLRYNLSEKYSNLKTQESINKAKEILSSIDKEFNEMETKQQTNALNEEINNYSSATDEINEEITKEIRSRSTSPNSLL